MSIFKPKKIEINTMKNFYFSFLFSLFLFFFLAFYF